MASEGRSATLAAAGAAALFAAAGAGGAVAVEVEAGDFSGTSAQTGSGETRQAVASEGVDARVRCRGELPAGPGDDEVAAAFCLAGDALEEAVGAWGEAAPDDAAARAADLDFGGI